MMTVFLPVADLTWPEAAALPRDMPLIIPLGDGYNMELAARALGHPAQVGLLPAIPYGWQNSGLTAAGCCFGADGA